MAAPIATHAAVAHADAAPLRPAMLPILAYGSSHATPPAAQQERARGPLPVPTRAPARAENVVEIVQPPSIEVFEADSLDVAAGQRVRLSWRTVQAAQVYLDLLPVGSAGSLEVAPAESRVYELLVMNPLGTRRASLYVAVTPAPHAEVVAAARLAPLASLAAPQPTPPPTASLVPTRTPTPSPTALPGVTPSATLPPTPTHPPTPTVEPTPTLTEEGRAALRALPLDQYPRPPEDNGRGMHWVPRTASPPWVVDRYVAEASAMRVRWVVFLNEGGQIGANDYLVTQLVARGIEPVMRVLTHRGAQLGHDLTPMVRHYRALGVRYYQLYNEPNLSSENQDRAPNVDRYLDLWLPAAGQVIAGGGLPGIGALAPDAHVDDVEFFRASLRGIEARGHLDVLDTAWVAVHNYLLGDPGVPVELDPGFRRPEIYDAVAREELGRSLPMIGTEGGFAAGGPPRDQADVTHRVLGAYAAVQRRGQPYVFAYTYWLIANEAGGGDDPTFSGQALFRPDGHSPLADALKQTP